MIKVIKGLSITQFKVSINTRIPYYAAFHQLFSWTSAGLSKCSIDKMISFQGHRTVWGAPWALLAISKELFQNIYIFLRFISSQRYQLRTHYMMLLIIELIAFLEENVRNCCSIKARNLHGWDKTDTTMISDSRNNQLKNVMFLDSTFLSMSRTDQLIHSPYQMTFRHYWDNRFNLKNYKFYKWLILKNEFFN